MADVYDRTVAALSVLGYPVREQGTYQPDEVLPQTHVTYQVIDQTNPGHADNMPISTTTRVQVTVYSTDPSVVQHADGLLRVAMLPSGFLRVTGRRLPLDPETGHYGYTSDYRLYESEG